MTLRYLTSSRAKGLLQRELTEVKSGQRMEQAPATVSTEL